MKKLWISILAMIILLAARACASDIPDFSGDWDEITLTEAGDSYVARKLTDYAILDLQGNVLASSSMTHTTKSTFGTSFLIPFQEFQGFGEKGWAPVELERNSYVIMNNDGSLRMQRRFQYISPADSKSGTCEFFENGKEGIIGRDGGILFDALFDEVYVSDDPDLFSVGNGGKYGFVTSGGEYLTDIIFDYTYGFSGSYASVKKDGKWGYINRDGSWYIRPVYRYAYNFDGWFAIVSPQKGKWGVINEAGTFILEPEYSQISSLEGLDAVIAVKNKKKICFNIYPDRAFKVGENPDGYPLTGPFEILRTEHFGYGISDSAGHVALSPFYYEITVTEDGLFEVNSESRDEHDYYYILKDNSGICKVAALNSAPDLRDYYPNSGKLVAKPEGKVSLNKRASKTHRLPNVDGDYNFLPLYAALVQATYPDDTKYANEGKDPVFTFSAIPLDRLAQGKADIVFVPEPSSEEVEKARAAGVELEITPIARDALVFVTSQDHELEDLTTAQVRGIYSGRITGWDALDSNETGSIIAYQQRESSPGQQVFRDIMLGLDVIRSPRCDNDDTWDPPDNIEYRNQPDAIGFGEGFHVSRLDSDDVKRLAIDSVYPSVEAISSGTYPYTFDICAVTRKGDDNPNTSAFLAWIQSDEAAGLIERAGYAPCNIEDTDLGTFDDPA